MTSKSIIFEKWLWVNEEDFFFFFNDKTSKTFKGNFKALEHPACPCGVMFTTTMMMLKRFFVCGCAHVLNTHHFMQCFGRKLIKE